MSWFPPKQLRKFQQWVQQGQHLCSSVGCQPPWPVPMLYHLCHISVSTMVMQKLGPCRVGYSGRTTEKGSCFNPPRWALGLLYKNVSFMFIQDQSGSFWAACDPFSKASGTCEIYSSAEAAHHEGYEGPRLWDDNNPCTFLSHPLSWANMSQPNASKWPDSWQLYAEIEQANPSKTCTAINHAFLTICPAFRAARVAQVSATFERRGSLPSPPPELQPTVRRKIRVPVRRCTAMPSQPGLGHWAAVNGKAGQLTGRPNPLGTNMSPASSMGPATALTMSYKTVFFPESASE